MGFAAAIRDARLVKQMSQGQLAQALGVRQPSVSSWEQGHTFPAIDLLAPLARTLDLDLAELVALAEKPDETEDADDPDASAGSATDVQRACNSSLRTPSTATPVAASAAPAEPLRR